MPVRGLINPGRRVDSSGSDYETFDRVRASGFRAALGTFAGFAANFVFAIPAGLKKIVGASVYGVLVTGPSSFARGFPARTLPQAQASC